MKVTRGLLFASVLAGSALVLASSQGTLLRAKFAEGDKESYAVTIKSNQVVQSPMGEQNINIDASMDYLLKVGKQNAETKAFDVEYVMSNLKMDMDTPMGNPGADAAKSMPKEITMKGTLDDRYRFKITSAANDASTKMLSSMMGGASMGQSLEFPEAAVNPGDTWDMVVPKNDATGSPETKFKVKFDGEVTVDNKSYYSLTMTGTMPMNMDVSKMMAGNADADPTGMLASMKIVVTGNNDVKNVCLYDKETGRLFKMTMTSGGDQKIMISGPMDMALDSKGSTVFSMKRKS